VINSENDAKSFVADRCNDRVIAKLEKYCDALIKENEKQNLVARSSLNLIWQRHITDSVQLLDHTDSNAAPWLDLGSGAGFPGLIIAICRDDIEVRLVESRRMRFEWLERMTKVLELTNCRVEGSRLELVKTFEAGTISARAFAPLDKLLPLAARFSTERTRWLLPKGRSAVQEVQRLNKGEEMFHVEQSITDSDAGIIVGSGRWS